MRKINNYKCQCSCNNHAIRSWDSIPIYSILYLWLNSVMLCQKPYTEVGYYSMSKIVLLFWPKWRPTCFCFFKPVYLSFLGLVLNISCGDVQMELVKLLEIDSADLNLCIYANFEKQWTIGLKTKWICVLKSKLVNPWYEHIVTILLLIYQGT